MTKRVLYIAVTIFIGVFIAIPISLYLYLNESVETPKQIYIPRGSISQIISHIDEVLDISLLPTDRYVIAYFGQPQSGWLELPERDMKRWEFLRAITKAKAPSTRVTLIPGETTQYFLKELAERYRGDFRKLYSYYLRISPMAEGFLIPDTYTINRNRDLEAFITKLVEHSKEIHKERVQNRDINFKELKRFIVIASIIEKESASKEEMRRVSSVIHNRLKKGMKLQMDGTLNYGLYSHIKVTAERIKKDKSQFNTYKIAGLPQLPVCNPSAEAIEAAIDPEETNYLFFVKVRGERRHIFTESYKEHLKEVEKLR